MIGMKGIGKEIKQVTGDLERLMKELVSLQEMQVTHLNEIKQEIIKSRGKPIIKEKTLENEPKKWEEREIRQDEKKDQKYY